MPRIFSPQLIELQPGVAPEEFETFVLMEIAPLYNQYPGLSASLLKGNRGLRIGQYALLLETDTDERRDYYFPESNEWPEDIKRMLEETATIWAKLDTYVVQFPDPQSTDYLVLGP